MPTFQRHEQLGRALAGFEVLDYPRDRFEVVVADDGSEPPVREVVRESDYGFDLKVVRQENAGPASARNLGARHASGELLVFTDDDCQPEPQWLKALAACHQKQPQAVIGGETLNALPENLFSTASQLLVDYLYEYYHDGTGRPGAFFTSNNLALARSVWEEVGGFDETFPLAAAEDREFCERLNRLGHALVLEREARVKHAHPMTWRSFWRQHAGYGAGARQLRSTRLSNGGEEVPREPLSFYLGLLSYPLRAKGQRRRLRLAFLSGMSQLANAAGFFSTRATGGRLEAGENRTTTRSRPR